MAKHKKVLSLIQEISNANPIMQDIFLAGSCLNFYFILKNVFPEAEAYFDHGHVITKIENRFYDISGEITDLTDYKPIGDWFTKYQTDEGVRASEMYSSFTKYIRDYANFTGIKSTCCESEIFTVLNLKRTFGHYLCKECGEKCDVQ